MLFCRSISHQNTPLAVREQLSLTHDEQLTWLNHLTNTDAILLATCNRLELYTSVESGAEMECLWASLFASKSVSMDTLNRYTVKLSDYEAAHHLFYVASSLKSMALGEAQILGQVTQAFEQSQQAGRAGHFLSMLFRAAIHTARRVHNETTINQGSVSVSSLGINRVEQFIPAFATQPMLVIGAGEMGQAVIKGLNHRHASDVTLVSRTYENAQHVAETWEIKARPMTHLKELLLQATVVFSTSSAPFPILTVDDMQPIMQERRYRDLYMVDIAVPRDVAPEVADIPGVHLFDLDNLEHAIRENRSEREKAVPLAHQIIQEELTRFWNEYEGRSVVPTIRQLREHVESIRQNELNRTLNRIPCEHQDEVRRLIEEFSHRFMNKILHQPTQNLKDKAGQGSGALYTSVARELFGLEE